MNLRKILEETGKKQNTIAQELNISKPTLNKYINGKTEPDISTLIKLADYFNISLDYLVGREWNNKAYVEVWKYSEEQKENIYLIEKLSIKNNLIASGYLQRLMDEQTEELLINKII